MRGGRRRPKWSERVHLRRVAHCVRTRCGNRSGLSSAASSPPPPQVSTALLFGRLRHLRRRDALNEAFQRLSLHPFPKVGFISCDDSSES
ncbi:hypothetical protein CDAR_548551 [Caerostris darwini]|uniref:Uncharacterized protein n=1 Tax=Caerostris darwini TaxID=1538125 RepID=A0AAV4WKR9_9ARAC|nr:hypothetical protein CDAR_548551 [Caerostris darwini]